MSTTRGQVARSRCNELVSPIVEVYTRCHRCHNCCSSLGGHQVTFVDDSWFLIDNFDRLLTCNRSRTDTTPTRCFSTSFTLLFECSCDVIKVSNCHLLEFDRYNEIRLEVEECQRKKFRTELTRKLDKLCIFLWNQTFIDAWYCVWLENHY